MSSGGQSPRDVLTAMVGKWQGVCRTWLTPGELLEETPVAASGRSWLGGRFVLFEYEGTIGGRPWQGLMVLGWDSAGGRWQMGWTDSFHNGDVQMWSEGPAVEGSTPRVRGSYRDPSGGPDWGWETSFRPEADGGLTVEHHNVPPGMEPVLAVQMELRAAS